MSVWWWVSMGAPLIVLASFGLCRLWTAATDRLPDDGDPDDAMSPAMAARFDAFRAHVDQAIALANNDSGCPMCALEQVERRSHP
jgi:hypothetical protein